MRITKIEINNYKSLRSVCFKPSQLSILVGANASGKSNFSDAFDFLSVVYRHGLEYAVAIKGGFENIALRKMKRTRKPIEFKLVCITNEKDARSFLTRNLPFYFRKEYNIEERFLKFEHIFSFKTAERRIGADFSVVYEKLTVSATRGKRFSLDDYYELFTISRNDKGVIDISCADYVVAEKMTDRIRLNKEEYGVTVSGQELFVSAGLSSGLSLYPFNYFLSNIVVYRFSPAVCREAGIPTPNPQLLVTGRNLPAVVNWIKNKYHDRWKEVIGYMRDILPNLEDITVQYLHTKSLGLFFKEKGYSRPWTSEEVSDGTLQVLSILIATVDPRNFMVLIEEPENSIHPWIITLLMDLFKRISKNTSVILTTHSPVVIDCISPEDLWIAYRSQGASHIRHILELRRTIVSEWKRGQYKLSEFLDSSLLPQAVPGGSVEDRNHS